MSTSTTGGETNCVGGSEVPYADLLLRVQKMKTDLDGKISFPNDTVDLLSEYCSNATSAIAMLSNTLKEAVDTINTLSTDVQNLHRRIEVLEQKDRSI